MTDKTHMLAIDNGTQSVRAVLIDLQGNIESKSQVVFAPYVSEKPGWVEQEADYFWSKLSEACQALWRKTGVAKKAIAGVAVTTQRNCVINIDRDGNVLRLAGVKSCRERVELHLQAGAGDEQTS